VIVLGTPVVFHHRAAVARWTKEKSDFSWLIGWTLFEGVGKSEVKKSEYVKYTEMFRRWPEIKGRGDKTINKTVMVWPEEGSGVVVGRVKRMRGISEPGRGYSDGDYDPGWFNATDGFHLYALRATLDGLKDYIFVPEWALAPMRGEQ
jgi:hypothetical protein